MADTALTGNVYLVETVSDGNTSITIPSTAAACIVICTGWNGSPSTDADFFDELNFDDGATVDFDLIRNGYYNTGDAGTSVAGYIITQDHTDWPGDGAKTLYYSAPSGGYAEGFVIQIFFVTNIDATPANVIVASETFIRSASINVRTSSLAGVGAADLGIVCATAYGTRVPDAIPSGYGQTIIDATNGAGNYNDAQTSIGYEVGESALRAECSDSGFVPLFFAIKNGTDAGSATEYILTAESGTFSIAGTAATLAVGTVLVAASGAFDISGTDASLLHNRALPADSGSFSITGTDADLVYGTANILTAESGTFSIAGTDASLLNNQVLLCQPGIFEYDGTPADLIQGYGLVAESGTFSIAGTDATLTYGSTTILTAESGAFSITGTDATLTYTPVGEIILTAEPGVFSISGTDSTLGYNQVVTAESGTFDISGTAATLSVGKVLVSDSGTFSITGTDVTFEYSIPNVLTAESGIFSINGTAATLTYTPDSVEHTLAPSKRCEYTNSEKRDYYTKAETRIGYS